MRLRSFFRSYWCPEVCAFFSRADDLHCVPIVGQFLAAVEANYVCASEAGCPTATRTGTKSKGKTTARVPTTENRIEQSCQHMPSNGELVSALGTSPESPLPRQNRAIAPGKEGAPLRRPATPRSAPAAKNYPCGIAACCLNYIGVLLEMELAETRETRK
jgi:hypothetical protein